MEFNKERCIANIYALAKEQGVKIGELESAANISVGYLSRLAKENNNALPNIEALVVISDRLNVSLDALVRRDLTVNDSTESYFVKVVDKLLDDTKFKPNIWVVEPEENLKNMTRKQVDKHPLFQTKTYREAVFDEDVCETMYNSIIPSDESVIINGDFFYADISKTTGFYLTSVKYPFGFEAYEIFLIDNGKIDPLCSTNGAGTVLTDKIKLLYQTVNETVNKPKIKDRVKNTLDQYIGGAFDIIR